MNREIIFYETAAGKCPVEEFLNSLAGQQARKVAWVLELIEEQPAVSRIENHAQDVKLSTLAKFAQVFGKTIRIEVV